MDKFDFHTILTIAAKTINCEPFAILGHCRKKELVICRVLLVDYIYGCDKSETKIGELLNRDHSYINFMKNQTLIRNDSLYIEKKEIFYKLLNEYKLKIYSYSNIIKLHEILMKCNQVLRDSDIKIIVSFDESVKHNRYLEVFNRLRQLERILTDVFFYLDKKEQKICKKILNWIELNEKINTI